MNQMTIQLMAKFFSQTYASSSSLIFRDFIKDKNIKKFPSHDMIALMSQSMTLKGKTSIAVK